MSLQSVLVENLDAVTAFARARTGDDELAREAVQAALVKALGRAHQLEHDERALAWFYRILRNTITDLYRARRHDELDPDTPAEAAELEAVACRCFEALLPEMNPGYAALIRRLDLNWERPEAVADDLGITMNNLKVKRHRARKQLRERLEDQCRLCAKPGCLDCTC